MPAKKKKGKASKLARMSDEERTRYLQHRAELELEAKRRKQQLIAVFTKNKLKREEAFSRLNTAKINEQWRFILRQIKCRELYVHVEYLWKNFDRTLETRDAVIQKLYDELETADADHRRSQEAHVTMLDRLIGMHRDRLATLRINYQQALKKIECGEVKELQELKKELNEDAKHLQTIIFAQKECLATKLAQTRTRNAVNTHNIVYSKEETLSELSRDIGSKMEDMWVQLNSIISEYMSNTESKRKQYEYLKEQDDAARMEAALFPKHQAQLQDTIEKLKEDLDVLSRDCEDTTTELRDQVQELNKRIWKLRHDTKLAGTIDAIQLKRLSVISAGVIKELESCKDKGMTLKLLLKICSNLELPLPAIEKYAICNENTGKESYSKYITNPYNKMEKFWEKYNRIKAENILMRKDHDRLCAENKRLRHNLRTYLITVVRSPASRPHTAI
ncbi:dynein regulatory complex subunit 2 [Cephus cinctus]|uniref:Dynein regulatory complex subunit 2 n=1 Tax=Cephus cinctus TaxID=211228 RepID=A0AAJ7FLA3_CEPCN|nr:dynein regulatory complex subunit 2 [Cephus cinctus]